MGSGGGGAPPPACGEAECCEPAPWVPTPGDRAVVVSGRDPWLSSALSSARPPLVEPGLPKPLVPPEKSARPAGAACVGAAAGAAAGTLAALLGARADINSLGEPAGSTALLLAVELLPRARAYEEMIRFLLEKDADPRLRATSGWSPIDVAVSRGDKAVVRLLFERAQVSLAQRWQSRLDPVVEALAALPDFECRIRWEFESPVPLLGRIAPSDILLIRKCGTSLRLDSTLASWTRFRLSKRRDLTTLFQGFLPGSSGPRLCMLNHAKQVAVDVAAELDPQEASAVVEDLVAADAMQWDLSVGSFEVLESTGWLGQALGPCDVNGWKATRFDVKGSLNVVVQKKGCRTNGATFEEYFGCPLPPAACLPELQEEFRKGREVHQAAGFSKPSTSSISSSEWFDGTDIAAMLETEALQEDLLDVEYISDFGQGMRASNAAFDQTDSRDCDAVSDAYGAFPMPAPPRGASSAAQTAAVPLAAGGGFAGGAASGSKQFKEGTKDRQGRSDRSVSASVWLATDFAIPMQHFMPVLEALSAEHEAMHRLRALLGSKSLQEAGERAKQVATGGGGAAGGGHVFPVKVSVPINLAVRALCHFELFELRPAGSLATSLFEVPASYRWALRREAQKTLGRRTKRALLACRQRGQRPPKRCFCAAAGSSLLAHAFATASARACRMQHKLRVADHMERPRSA